MRISLISKPLWETSRILIPNERMRQRVLKRIEICSRYIGRKNSRMIEQKLLKNDSYVSDKAKKFSHQSFGRSMERRYICKISVYMNSLKKIQAIFRNNYRPPGVKS